MLGLAHYSKVLAPHAPAATRARQQSRRLQAVAEAPAAAETSSAPATPAAAAPTSQQQVYIGKGRFINDDPRKYPGRDNDFTGGWAGGEVGLKAFVEDLAAPGGASKPAAKAAKPAGELPPQLSGRDEIYVGKGRTVKGNASKFPQKTELTGGFAGGEEGVKAFVATGDVPIAAPGAARRRQQSPLIVAGMVALASTAGGLLINSLEEVGEEAVSGASALSTVASTAKAAAMDDSTRLLLEVAVVLIGVAGTVAGGRALIASVTSQIKDSVSRLATLAVFWAFVFVAAKLVLEAP